MSTDRRLGPTPTLAAADGRSVAGDKKGAIGGGGPRGGIRPRPRPLDSRSQLSVCSGGLPATVPSAKAAPVVRQEPTYRTAPDEDRMFQTGHVESIIKETLDAYLHKARYEPDHCSRLAHNLCSVIKARVKEAQYKRYRLVVQVLVGQDSEQGVQQASRCLWNPQTDNFAAATYRNNSLYAIAVVYGLYLD